jgi:hypothetical protein
MIIPETVILDTQEQAYVRKTQLAALRAKAAEKRKIADDADAAVAHSERQLTEVAAFLQEQCPDALKGDETWFSQLGVVAPPSAKKRSP